jgi:histidine triad (HIT) family protein
MKDCIFCKIAKKRIEADIIYKDEKVIAFLDINPKAPIHILVIPKTHIENINKVQKENQELLGHMILIAQRIAQNKKISQDGYRLVFNTNKNSGQIVDHLHLHIVGGKKLGNIC